MDQGNPERSRSSEPDKIGEAGSSASVDDEATRSANPSTRGDVAQYAERPPRNVDSREEVDTSAEDGPKSDGATSGADQPKSAASAKAGAVGKAGPSVKRPVKGKKAGTVQGKSERRPGSTRAKSEASPVERSASPIPNSAMPARIRSRHRNLALSLLLVVGLPVLLSAVYLAVFAQDQYASTTGFTIRQVETEAASEILGGLTQLVGGGSAGNADLLFEFLHSQEIVERVNDQFDLKAHYSATWPQDPVFSIWPEATVEDLLWFWRRMVRITYNQSSGLIVVQVRARDAAVARDIARMIVSESESMINMLNETARRDTMASAETDLEEAVERLRGAREEMVAFRARTQILDPMADIQGRMGVLNNLQQQLAQALVDYDLLLHTAESGDPRLRQAMRRIEVIRDRIVDERRSFAAQDVTVEDTDYPQLLAQYESLRVSQEYAEQSYGAALAAFDAARSNAQRQQLYLATFIRPTLAQRAEFPQRLLLIGLTALFAGMIWAILALSYYSLRDRG